MSTQKKIWCEYSPSKHRWIEDNEDNGGQCIKQNFSNDICKIFMEYDSIIQKKVLDFQDSGDNDGIEMWQKKKAKNLKLQNQLKDTGFKETLLKECTEKFLDADFKNTLDTNLNLINCPNGVYDLVCTRTDVFKHILIPCSHVVRLPPYVLDKAAPTISFR